MNNIRKIIEERLENARNDWLLDKRDYLRGQMVSYRDCLNLIPALRTEKEILNDFEKLGYSITYYSGIECYNLTGKGFILHINKKERKYGIRTNFPNCDCIGSQEHKLLNELFICWRWL